MHVCTTVLLSEVHPPSFSHWGAEIKAKMPDCTLSSGVGTGIHPAGCHGGDWFDQRQMIDRGDFLNHCGKISQSSFVSSLQLQSGNILADSCPDCSCCLSLTHKHMCMCTTEYSEVITGQMYMQQVLNYIFILKSKKAVPWKLNIDQNYCTIKAW